jgi:hypothetical protein
MWCEKQICGEERSTRDTLWLPVWHYGRKRLRVSGLRCTPVLQIPRRVQGNNVNDQNWEVAPFNEMASTPATMEASRIVDAYGCFPRCAIEGRDVEQAYLQAETQGPPVWITLPKELWTEDMHKMRNPVVRLEKELYGHKHSGVFWQQHC